MKRNRILPLIPVLLLLLLCSCAHQSKTSDSEEKIELHVFAAASLKNAMTQLQKEYTLLHPNIQILLNTESSGTLQTQIEEGALCDIFFSASTKQTDALLEKALLVPDSIVELLENQVVLITSMNSATKVSSFETIPLASSLALASEDVPIGQYAREIFTSLGIEDEIMAMEINEGPNVTAVLSAVSEKSNEVGIVYATDAASLKDSVQILCFAPNKSMKKPAIYPVAQVVNHEADGKKISATKAFLNYLQGKEASKIFESYGFTVND